MSENIPEEIKSLITSFYNNSNYENIDNLRVAKLSNTSEVNEYERAYKDGCCGFYDEIICVNRELWIVGFNYGH